MRLVAEPAKLVMQAGDSAVFKVTAYDAGGNVVQNPNVRVGGPRRSIMFSDGHVKAFEAGSFTATATASDATGGSPVTLDIPVTITWPPVARLELAPSPGRLYAHVTLAHTARGYFAGGMERKGLQVNWKSSDPSVASVDRFGNVTGLKAGTATITAEGGGAKAEKKYVVATNPVSRLSLAIKESSVRAGDVIHLNGKALRLGSLASGGGVAQTSGGYTHIVDFTDPMHPRQVARYHLEDYGSHDIIVKDDVLYQAYYDGGVRLVDVSGELLGNLADQNREIAVFKPWDPKAFTANASFVMNAMPWKGQTLFTDFNSGLWAAKLEPKAPVVP